MDAEGPDLPPPSLHILAKVAAELERGQHAGCGCQSLQHLRKWFTPTEYKKLLWFGYRCVAIPNCELAHDSGQEIVFTRARALRKGVKVVALYEEE